jgi:hypothetical protein
LRNPVPSAVLLVDRGRDVRIPQTDMIVRCQDGPSYDSGTSFQAARPSMVSGFST